MEDERRFERKGRTGFPFRKLQSNPIPLKSVRGQGTLMRKAPGVPKPASRTALRKTLRRWRRALVDVALFRCVSERQARKAFDVLTAIAFDPRQPDLEGIPFSYPETGQAARAHAACRAMIGMGLKPGKLWIAGGPFLIGCANSVGGVAQVYQYNVAPTLRTFRGWPPELVVLDPAYFDGPVNERTWIKAHQSTGEPRSTWIRYTGPEIYMIEAGGFGIIDTDEDYKKTEVVLQICRDKLTERVGIFGSPPYV